MALKPFYADVPLRNYTLTHSSQTTWQLFQKKCYRLPSQRNMPNLYMLKIQHGGVRHIKFWIMWHMQIKHMVTKWWWWW